MFKINTWDKNFSNRCIYISGKINNKTVTFPFTQKSADSEGLLKNTNNGEWK